MITIPTTKTLFDRIKADIEAQYGDAMPIYGKVFLFALVAVMAGVFKVFYLGLGNIQKNIFPDAADPESLGGTLERFGVIKLGRPPAPAKQGKYTVSVEGDAGAIIPAGTTFTSDDDSSNPSANFILDEEYELTGTGDEILIRALDGGLVSRLIVGDTLTANSPIGLVESQVTVTEETEIPVDEEDIEDYRDKVVQAFRIEPQGGAVVDYRLWAADEPTVKQVYPYVVSGAPGEINIFIEATTDASTDGYGTPNQDTLDAVAEYVEYAPDPENILSVGQRGRRPMGVFDVHVLPIQTKKVNVTINGFLPTPTSEVQALVELAIEEVINTIRPFIAAADPANSEFSGYLDASKISYAISSAVRGSVFTSIELELDDTPISNYTFDNGEIPYLDGVTFA